MYRIQRLTTEITELRDCIENAKANGEGIYENDVVYNPTKRE